MPYDNLSNMRTSLLSRFFSAGLLTLGCLLYLAPALNASPVSLSDLRVEYREAPLGIDVTAPRLSWRLESVAEVRGLRQSAYQVRVATSEELLKQEKPDLWDSGKVESDRTFQVEYAGKPLTSRTRCHWQVRVWGQDGKASEWSKPSLWTMGLLDREEWQAEWIGYDAAYNLTPEEQADNRLLNTHRAPWMGIPAGSGEVSVPTGFRYRLELPADRTLRRAVLVLYTFHSCEAWVNGTAVGSAFHWDKTARLDITAQLRAGDNMIALLGDHTDPHRASIAGRLVVQFESGEDSIITTNKDWKASQKLPENWKDLDFDDAAWVSAREGAIPWGRTPPVGDVARVPAPYLRRAFDVDQPVRRATVYVTALGTYELRLNGERVGEDILAPGWTNFRKRVHYQTYDVTQQVKQGANAIGAILGDGWYASNLAHLGNRNHYGGKPRLLVQLEIERADGQIQTILSDDQWKASYGPIRHADLQIGCEYDARLKMPGWDHTGFDDSSWAAVISSSSQGSQTNITAMLNEQIKDNQLTIEINNQSMGGDPAPRARKVMEITYQADGKTHSKTLNENQKLEISGTGLQVTRATYGRPSSSDGGPIIQASVAEPSRVINELPAVRLTEPRPGRWTFDLGQNMVGWVRLKVRGEAGQRITIRHAEMVNADGTIYTAALRGCPATDYYIPAGNDEEVFEPYFTFHGFQHVEITGLTSPPKLEDVTGIAVHTPMRRTGNFESSHELLNKLYSNIIWGQKGNFLEVPTDCPQRDERMGWTGDTQFFAPTALYNFDGANFYTRWLQNCEDDQFKDGRFPDVVPRIWGAGGSTAWGDAAVICTYLVYQAYNDTRIIEQRFESLERYMKWLEGKVDDEGVTKVGGYGDWLNAGSTAPKPLMDTAYHAYLSGIMSDMAAAIGRDDDAKRYAERNSKVTQNFTKNFLDETGALQNSGQTGYALAFTMNLLPDAMHEKATEHYIESIRSKDWHLGTGFIGTPRLLPGLAKAGRDDVAYRLLLTETYPSWLFPVKNGATTMWERWNGWTPETGFGRVGMNSFNHYAFGAVGEYLYSSIGGIRATTPGYRTILVRPAIPGPEWKDKTATLDWANTSFLSPSGTIASNWRLDSGKLTLKVEIPPNTTAEVHVPTSDAATVTESGKPANNAPGVRFLRSENGAAVYEVGSGRYAFTSTR